MAGLEQRKILLDKAHNDKTLQAELLEICKRDIVFWFEHFCWTYDPRLKQPHLPFNLYPYQKQVVRALEVCVTQGEHALIEKSRDMGLSWLALLVFQYYWLFYPGSDFCLGSKKEELVDKRGVLSTLFPKLRYNAEMLPMWMLPKLDKVHDSALKLINPLNKNSIVGEAATQDFSRSGRYRAVLLDEFARHPYAELAFESANHSTNCIVLLFTPYGKGNHAYRLAVQEDLKNVPLQMEDTEDELARTLRLF